MRAFIDRNAFWMASVVTLAYAVYFLFPLLVFEPMDMTNDLGLISVDWILASVVPQAIMAFSVLAIVWVFGWWRQTGLTTRPDPAGLRLSAWVGALPASLLVLFAVMALLQPGGFGFRSPGPVIAAILMLNLGVGLFEEILFRGLLMNGLRQKLSLPTAIVTSSILFGLLHIVSLGYGQTLAVTTVQVLTATALGGLFCVLVLQANSLWPAIALHAIYNSQAMILIFLIEENVDPADLPQQVTSLAATDFILPTILTLLSVYLYRRWTRRMNRPGPPPIPR